MSHIKLHSSFNFQKIGKQVLEIECVGLAQLDQYINQDFDLACKMIFCCSGKVIVMGTGKSGHIGRKIAATFASTGTSSFFVHPCEAAHGDLGMITSKDIVVALSNSGQSHEILTLIPSLKQMRIPLICITSHPESSMALVSDIHLCVKVPKEACPFGLIPTSSTTATLVMGDALAISILKARGFTEENFFLFHPSGAIGRRTSLRVNDIMRTGNAIPYVNHDSSLRDALSEITRKNIGMTVICDDSMKIEGVFTDDDLRDVFSTNINLSTSIRDVKKSRGIRVPPTTLAVEAFNIIKSRNISSVIVTEEDQLLGIAHIYDFLRAGIA